MASAGSSDGGDGTGGAVAADAVEPSDKVAGGSWRAEMPDASLEADLRGLRVDEVDHALRRALDDAIVGGLPELRVIHGKGTGALRARVKELLREDARIRDFRAGGAGEGGAGVTVVSLP
jgi:DNA mismatch repair protein MutS2